MLPDFIQNLQVGFSTALSISNLVYAFFGTLLGTVVGVLPGVGPFAAISILLPLVISIGDPITSIIFLASIYYGAQYGGSTSSILLKIPGEVSSVVTVIDGYELTKQGRAGTALSISALSSFLAGTISVLFIAMFAIPLASLALKFGPVEYTSLMLMALLTSVMLTNDSLLKSLGMTLVGILLGLIGIDVNSGTERFTFGMPDLLDGISFSIIAMSIFGLAEILYSLAHNNTKQSVGNIDKVYPSKQDIKDSLPAALRGTFIGALLGILPGGGAVLGTFISYIFEKKISKNPEKFGNGALEGVAAPEAANNAGAQTSFIPMLSLGLPTTPVMAVIIAALMMFNIQPGPTMISQNNNLFWGFVVSLWIGNLFLLILNLPMIKIWVQLLRLPQWSFIPLLLTICVCGTYYINNNWFEVLLLVPFTLIGYLLKLTNCNPAPLAMGFILGPMMEEYLRRSLIISNGSWMIFIEHPISATLLAAILIFLLIKIFCFRSNT